MRQCLEENLAGQRRLEAWRTIQPLIAGDNLSASQSQQECNIHLRQTAASAMCAKIIWDGGVHKLAVVRTVCVPAYPFSVSYLSADIKTSKRATPYQLVTDEVVGSYGSESHRELTARLLSFATSSQTDPRYTGSKLHQARGSGWGNANPTPFAFQPSPSSGNMSSVSTSLPGSRNDCSRTS